ncbi:MAG: YbbR-like domain-containing protein [Wujia sp.]
MRKKDDINHIGYKILSVVLAIVAWLAVANISDYQTTREISDIPVTQINGDVLEELDQVYDVASGDTVDIVVKGRRSVVGTLGREDFIATADLSTMSITNTVPIVVTTKDSSIKDEIDITCVDSTMKLNLEDKVTGQFPIKVVTTGSTKEGYAVSSSTANPNIVKIEGPKSAVEKITEVRVAVDVEGKKESFSTESEIALYDAYGEEIKNDKIVMNVTSAKADVEIYKTKTVPVNVELRGTPGDGYGVESIVYQPQNIEIVGPEDVLGDIESVEIRDISVSGMTEDFQNEVDIRDYLQEGVSVVNVAPEFAVNVTVAKLTEKVLTPSENSFILKNQADGNQYEISLDNYRITISGFADVVSSVTIDNVQPTIDCGSLPSGNHNNVTVTLKELEGITYDTSGSVSVNVTSSGK